MPRPYPAALPCLALESRRRGVELGEVAAEAVGDEVFDAVAGAVEALAGAADLAAFELALLERAQVLLQARQAIGAQPSTEPLE